MNAPLTAPAQRTTPIRRGTHGPKHSDQAGHEPSAPAEEMDPDAIMDLAVVVESVIRSDNMEPDHVTMPGVMGPG